MIDAQNQLELKVNASIYWTTSVNGDTSGLKEVYIPSLWWLIYLGKQTAKLKKDFTKVSRVGLVFDFNL